MMQKILLAILIFGVMSLGSAAQEKSSKPVAPAVKAGGNVKTDPQEKTVKTEAVPKAKESGNEVYHVLIRVIFAGTTGIYGSLPQELQDMKDILTQSFHYPAFDLSNTIRLSFFGDEDATAAVFPDHYIRLIPKGTSKDGKSVKVKAELYSVPQENNITAKYYLPIPEKANGKDPANPNPDTQDTPVNQFPAMATIEEKSGGKQPLLPLVSSAVILNNQTWEAFGGVPVRMNSQDRVSSNTLSSNPMANQAAGQKKFLILGMQLEKTP